MGLSVSGIMGVREVQGYGQGRISHIGNLGTCLGRQLNRGDTSNKKKKKGKLGQKLYSSSPFTSNPRAI